MKLTFATASASVAPEIAALRTAASARLTEKFGHGPWSAASTERAVLRELTRPKFERTLTAKAGSVIVAALHLQTKKPWAIDTAYFTQAERALYLVSMAVLPSWQGQGAGRMLLDEAVSVAKEWPAHALRLDAWDAAAGAGPFYKKCGFKEVGRVVYREVPLVYYEFLLS